VRGGDERALLEAPSVVDELRHFSAVRWRSRQSARRAASDLHTFSICSMDGGISALSLIVSALGYADK